MKTLEMLNLLQTDQQSAYVGLNKPHAHVAMTQMSMKAGIKKFGDKGNEALLKELRQLHVRGAMVPKRKDEMTEDDKKKSLRCLMFMKEKRDGTIKAWGCADGRPQHIYTQTEEASSPTVSIDQHSRSLLACRHERDCTYDTGRDNHQANCQT